MSVDQGQRNCATCDDDGWVEFWPDDDETLEVPVNRECPHLHEPWHKPFNASGLLGSEQAS